MFIVQQILKEIKELLTDGVTKKSVYNAGKHVDVVIVDDGASHDMDEWDAPQQQRLNYF